VTCTEIPFNTLRVTWCSLEKKSSPVEKALSRSVSLLLLLERPASLSSAESRLLGPPGDSGLAAPEAAVAPLSAVLRSSRLEKEDFLEGGPEVLGGEGVLETSAALKPDPRRVMPCNPKQGLISRGVREYKYLTF